MKNKSSLADYDFIKNDNELRTYIENKKLYTENDLFNELDKIEKELDKLDLELDNAKTVDEVVGIRLRFSKFKNDLSKIRKIIFELI